MTSTGLRWQSQHYVTVFRRLGMLGEHVFPLGFLIPRGHLRCERAPLLGFGWAAHEKPRPKERVLTFWPGTGCPIPGTGNSRGWCLRNGPLEVDPEWAP